MKNINAYYMFLFSSDLPQKDSVTKAIKVAKVVEHRI
jgi:hypothetical protein